ncbi:DUF6923 family protein [Allocoleopsis sp.]|uniref:DUF6923 family protein n=1 Tax=Allocoleopsis sp. TaxID=3088169 RepID=UPI002FD58876
MYRNDLPPAARTWQRKVLIGVTRCGNYWRKRIHRLTAFIAALILAIALSYSPPAPAQSSASFPCTNTLYVSRGQGTDVTDVTAPTALNTLNINVNPFTLDPIPGIPINANIRYNAIGFNFQDGLIYGIDPDTGTVYRIAPNGLPTSLGVPAGLPGRPILYLAGDVDVNGNYLILSSNPQNSQNQQLFTINVAGGVATLVGAAVTLSQATEIADFAINPRDGQLYGFDTITRQVARIDRTTGAVTFLPLPNPQISTVGGAFFDAFGQFFAYETSATTSAFYLVDVGTVDAPGTGQFALLSRAQGVVRNDGAACAFALQVEKRALPETIPAGGTVTYIYRIANISPLTLTNLRFRDEMANGRTFVANTLRLTDIIGGTPNNYGTTNLLEITGITIQARTIAQISVDVRIPPNTPPGTIFNQSELFGLPPRFGAPSLPSDYIPVVGFPDPTPLQVTANPSIGLAKTVTSVVDLGNGNFQLTYILAIQNFGNVDLNNVQVTENLSNTFGSTPFTVNRVSSPTGNLAPNNNFNGVNDTNLLSGTDTLAIGATKTLELVVTMTPGNKLSPYDNQAEATAQSSAGPTRDISTNGLNPDPDGNGNPSDNNNSTPLDLANPPGTGPRLRLVKRITNATRSGVPISGINFNSVVNDPNDISDDASGWSQLPGQLLGITQLGSETPLQSGDEVEYTVYFLSDGSQEVKDVRICDPVPSGTTFISDSFGAGRGILLNQNATQTPQTNASDTDQGTFASPLTPVTSPCPNSNNPKGSVLLQLGDIFNTSPSNIGFVRFRVKID